MEALEGHLLSSRIWEYFTQCTWAYHLIVFNNKWIYEIIKMTVENFRRNKILSLLAVRFLLSAFSLIPVPLISTFFP